MTLTEGDVIHVDKFEDLRAKFAIWVHLRTSEIKTKYCFIKDAERIVFMTLGVVKMMRFLHDCRKLISKGGISDIKL